MLKTLLMPLLCSLLAIACQSGDDPEARAAELTASPGLRVEISGAELSHDTVRAIAQHLEGGAKDDGAAMVRIKKEDGATPTVAIELWGGTVPASGDVPGALKAKFPELAAATITTSTIAAGAPPSLPVVAVDADLSPAEAEQQIRDQLAADGVDGDVNVKVEDGPEGRRVQVDVKKTETH